MDNDGGQAPPAGRAADSTGIALTAVVQRRLVAFDPATGAPIVTVVPMLTKAAIGDLAGAALSLPYEDPLGIEPHYVGMTCGEVAMAKRAQRAALNGDSVETEMLLDRAIGKPKSSAENVNVNLSGTYESFLREKAATAGPAEPAPVIVDAEIVEPVDPLFG